MTQEVAMVNTGGPYVHGAENRDGKTGAASPPGPIAVEQGCSFKEVDNPY
jgi:hypothetical protein